MLKVTDSNFSNYCYKNPAPQNTSARAQAPVLKKDIVSFGFERMSQIPEDFQVYRAIGLSEYEALLKGKTLEGSFYATSDPKGWATTNWRTGFGHGVKDCYFVTFKTNRLKIFDRRDSALDTRFGVGTYSLEDVENIRKGHNAHGELVYAQNFDEAKAKDIAEKKEEIKRLESVLAARQSSNWFIRFKSMLDEYHPQFLADIYDELDSYKAEFPELVQKVKEKYPNPRNF